MDDHIYSVEGFGVYRVTKGDRHQIASGALTVVLEAVEVDLATKEGRTRIRQLAAQLGISLFLAPDIAGTVSIPRGVTSAEFQELLTISQGGEYRVETWGARILWPQRKELVVIEPFELGPQRLDYTPKPAQITSDGDHLLIEQHGFRFTVRKSDLKTVKAQRLFNVTDFPADVN